MQLEDQGEWERCRSLRRMFLALTDADKPVAPIAEKLLQAMKRFRPRSEATTAAEYYWTHGMLDQKQPHRKKEIADRAYIVLGCAAKAFSEEGKRPVVVGGGEILVCEAIRREYPLAPGGFRKVGRLEGNPTSTGDSTRITPHKSTLKNVGAMKVGDELRFLLDLAI